MCTACDAIQRVQQTGHKRSLGTGLRSNTQVLTACEEARAFVYWKFRRRITAIVYGGSFRSFRRHHVYLL